jgi:elongation factor Tu
MEALMLGSNQLEMLQKPFLMPVEDVFSITGRGTVATGRIETGFANTGDPVEIIGMGAEKLTSTITGVEMFRKILDRGEAGDNVGILFKRYSKETLKEEWLFVSQVKATLHLKLRFIS